MKNIILITTLLFTTLVIAQTRPQKNEIRQERSHLNDASPEQLATLRAKKLRLELDLSEAQELEIRKLETDRITSARAKKLDRQQREALSVDEKVALRQDRLENAIAHKEKMKNVLSAIQYERWEKHMRHRMKRMKSHKNEMKKRH